MEAKLNGEKSRFHKCCAINDCILCAQTPETQFFFSKLLFSWHYRKENDYIAHNHNKFEWHATVTIVFLQANDFSQIFKAKLALISLFFFASQCIRFLFFKTWLQNKHIILCWFHCTFKDVFNSFWQNSEKIHVWLYVFQ